MKKYLFSILLVGLISFAILSCDDDDGYSIYDRWISIGTVENTNNEPYFYIRLDNDEVLWVSSTRYYNYRPSTGQRILANYTIISDRPEGSGYDHDIILNEAYNVLTKGIFEITPETQDSIGNDPVGIKRMWVGSDYLNVQFTYRGYNKTHFINLVWDESKEYEDGKIHLEFRHNTNNDSQQRTINGIVSFNLSSLQSFTENEYIDLVIHVTEYNEEKTYDLTYKFNNWETEIQDFTTTFFNEGKEMDVE